MVQRGGGPAQSHLVEAPRCLRNSLPPGLPVPCGHTALLTGQPLLSSFPCRRPGLSPRMPSSSQRG